MAVTFAGKQTGYADPTMRHEPKLDAFVGTPTFAGVQPKGGTTPSVHRVKRHQRDRTPLRTWFDEVEDRDSSAKGDVL